MKKIIFDVETTGLPVKGGDLEKQPHIIEFGAMFIDDDGSIIRTISQLINPGDRIWDAKEKVFRTDLPFIIPKITGIKNEDLVGKPTFNEFSLFLSSFFKGADALIAHNAKFDVGVLTGELARRPDHKQWPFPWPEQTLCTMHEYAHLKGIPGNEYIKLTLVYEKIMQKALKQTHRALDDCMAVHEILVADKYFERIEGENGSLPTL